MSSTYPLHGGQMTFLLSWSLEVFPLYRSSRVTLHKYTKVEILIQDSREERKKNLLKWMDSVLSSLTSLSSRSPAHASKKTTTKKVWKNVISTKSSMLMHPFLQSFQSMPVINFPFLGIWQNFISKRDFFKLFSSFWILVRVELFG